MPFTISFALKSEQIMKLLVHLHIYYYDQIPYFIEKLSNISGVAWDLFITETKHNEDVEKIFNNLRVIPHYIETDNVGYDIWPFIKVVKSVNLDDYDLILKLHTKNIRDHNSKINGCRLNGPQWRNELVDSLLINRKHFGKLINMFKHDDRLGLICSYQLYSKKSNNRPEDLSMLQNELGRLGFKFQGDRFCAGSMFMAKAGLYGFLQSDNIQASMFEGIARTKSIGSMAHVYERILSMVPYEYSHTVKTIHTNYLRSLQIMVSGYMKPLLEWLFSITVIGENRQKFLTLLGIRFLIRK